MLASPADADIERGERRFTPGLLRPGRPREQHWIPESIIQHLRRGLPSSLSSRRIPRRDLGIRLSAVSDESRTSAHGSTGNRPFLRSAGARLRDLQCVCPGRNLANRESFPNVGSEAASQRLHRLGSAAYGPTALFARRDLGDLGCCFKGCADALAHANTTCKSLRVGCHFWISCPASTPKT